jgi:hypothetical protein
MYPMVHAVTKSGSLIVAGRSTESQSEHAVDLPGWVLPRFLLSALALGGLGFAGVIDAVEGEWAAED